MPAFSKSNKSQQISRFNPRRHASAVPHWLAPYYWARHACELILPISLAISLSACSKPAEDSLPGQPVKARQTAFKEMLRVFESTGTMLRDGKFVAGKFEALAAELIAKRSGPWEHFGPDTNYPPTKAKPEVWAKLVQFEQAREKFFKSTVTLLIAAQAKEFKAVTDAYATVYDACQSCHRQFKKK